MLCFPLPFSFPFTLSAGKIFAQSLLRDAGKFAIAEIAEQRSEESKLVGLFNEFLENRNTNNLGWILLCYNPSVDTAFVEWVSRIIHFFITHCEQFCGKTTHGFCTTTTRIRFIHCHPSATYFIRLRVQIQSQAFVPERD